MSLKNILCAGLVLGLCPGLAAAIDTRDTRMLQEPALSSTHVAFVYADDLWVAKLDGSDVRRLTAHPGTESSPRFSRDGQWIAFTGEYDGNRDVYLVSVAGGEPRRLTWHPDADRARDFSPDGKSVLFLSTRDMPNRGGGSLFSVPIEGGFPTRLPIPSADLASLSPDGRKLAYSPLFSQHEEWKNYRGGTASRIWIADLDSLAVEMVPQPPGRSNDVNPMWIGETVYFLSDRAENGTFSEQNLFAYDTRSKQVRRLTNHGDFPVLAASAGGGKIVYEQAGYLHLFDPASGASRRLVLGVAADLPETRPRMAKGAKFVRDADLSPSGARAVLEFRGEIITVPAEKGDPRNLTETVGAHERSPIWSPDGKSIAYFSDASGEYQLVVEGQDGKGEAKSYKLEGAGFYQFPLWSPDGKKIAYKDNSMTLFWIDLATGKQKRIASEPYYGPFNARLHAWSPDSRWIAYALGNEAYMQDVWLYSLADDRSTRVSDGLADVTEPVFDRGGKFLYFTGSTDAGPVRQWFDMSTNPAMATDKVYLAVLSKDEPSPFRAESDEEKGKEEAKEDAAKSEDASSKKKGNGKKDEAKSEDAKSEEPAPIKVDLEGIASRIVVAPVGQGAHFALTAGGEGELFYLVVENGLGFFNQGTPGTLKRFRVKDRKEETLLEGVQGLRASSDGKKLLVQLPQGGLLIADGGAKIDPSSGMLNLDAVTVKVEPRAEWAQMLDEAWRINRDYFYDPGMHGADWPAVREKYRALLPHLATRSDLDRVMVWQGSEVGVGHHFTFGGDHLYEPKRVPGGLLGADFELSEGRYRFQKVYGGLNWNPDLRSPLTEPGVNVKAGEYLLAVNGRDLRPPRDVYEPFEGLAGKIVELTVGPSADGKGSRTVQVVPIENEGNLRHREWIESNRRRVEEASQGRVAYVYLPNTTAQGYESFRRYFFPQSYREGIILDERFNGGGQVADYYIDMMRRPFISRWATRYGKNQVTPKAAIPGPKVMLINESAGSGGDLLPWMFRKLEIGTLVGRPTWGGLVGILGFPILLDGGFTTAPNIAIWTEDGGWVVENEGVPPDVEVEQLPVEVAKGRDPQLEKAIEVAMKQLPPSPPEPPARPVFPLRVGRP